MFTKETGKCDRCKQTTEKNFITGSYFNTDMLCESCRIKEEEHHQFQHAKSIEHAHVLAGNYNFPGIGLPDDLKV